jgi:undecaprenyl-diphosphatase
MEWVQAIFLAVLQGVVEFLPISSSGHLILVPALLGWDDRGLGFDIAVHFGTLIAVVWYFHRDIRTMGADWFGSLRGAPLSPDARLAWAVILGTVPLAVAGAIAGAWFSEGLRTPGIIAAATAGFGLALWLADRYSSHARDEHTLAWRDVLAIGLGQTLALIPGTSRSGITMTVGLALGLSRAGAARFSFLLAIPAIGMAAVWQLIKFVAEPGTVNWPILGVATGVAAITAYVTIKLFMRLIQSTGMLVFAAYRLLLAGVIVYVLL